jgi:predicted component of type VI protein secretion system
MVRHRPALCEGSKEYMKLSLVVNQGKTEGKEVPIRLNQFLIGRDPECHLRPASPLVSKRHCAVLVRNGKVYLRDFESTNGTIVNGQPLKGETELQDGDQFSIGPLGFRVKLSATAAPTPIPPPAPTPTSAAVPATVTAELVPTEPTPKPRTKSASNDEDAVADLLLNFEGSPAGASGGLPPEGDPIPPGSTVMEVPAGVSAPPGETGDKQDKTAADPKKKKLVIDAAATANAAKAILDKYMRRPRT